MRYIDRDGAKITGEAWRVLLRVQGYDVIQETALGGARRIVTRWVGCAADCEKVPGYYMSELIDEGSKKTNGSRRPRWTVNRDAAIRQHELMVKTYA